MKKLLAAILVTLMTGSVALADQLKITVDVSATNRTTEIVGADIYANIDGKLTEISVTPDDNVPFKLNGKFGALRLKGFYQTQKQRKGKETPIIDSTVQEVK